MSKKNFTSATLTRRLVNFKLLAEKYYVLLLGISYHIILQFHRGTSLAIFVFFVFDYNILYLSTTLLSFWTQMLATNPRRCFYNFLTGSRLLKWRSPARGLEVANRLTRLTLCSYHFIGQHFSLALYQGDWLYFYQYDTVTVDSTLGFCTKVVRTYMHF